MGGSAHTALKILLAAAILALGSCGEPDPSPSITVFAAASTAPLLTEIAAAYERGTGVHVRLNTAASSTLARQIESGADADVFISAHAQWMDRLEEAKLIDPASRRDYLGNRLVLVVPQADSLGLVVNFKMNHQFDFAEAWPGRMAIGDPEHVPVGMYAKQALTALRWWDDLTDRVIPAADAQSVARLVELGEVETAIVYASDVETNSAIATFAFFPPESHDPIVYPVALVQGADERARAFVEALFTSPYGALRADWGFLTPGDG